MKVAVLHGAVPPDARADERDVLVEAREIAAALSRIGHEPVAGNIRPRRAGSDCSPARLRPELVFNLVESVDGSGRLIHLAPAVLDHLGMPYTGARTEAQFVTSNKLVSKRLLRVADIATPPWVALTTAPPAPSSRGTSHRQDGVGARVRGLDEDSVLVPTRVRPSSGRSSRAAVAARRRLLRRSLRRGPRVQPVGPGRPPRPRGAAARRRSSFEAYPEGKHRVVGFRAKWDEDSFEYQHTRRSFDFAEEEALLARAARRGRALLAPVRASGPCARGLSRRRDGDPWVLEVNTNPCISPDAGFIAAAGRAGFGIDEVVQRIIADTFASLS